MHDLEYQNAISIFVFQFSILGLSLFFMLLWSKPSLVSRPLPIIRFPISKLTFMHNFEYHNTILISVFQFSILGLPLFFTLLWSKTYFGIRNELNFRFIISKLTFMNFFIIKMLLQTVIKQNTWFHNIGITHVLLCINICRVPITCAWIYENLLPCLMLRTFFLISSKNFEKITADEINENFDQSDS